MFPPHRLWTRPGRKPWLLGSVCLPTILWVLGCPATDGLIDGNTDPLTDGNKDPSLTSPLGKTWGEPNDSFEDAIVAMFDDDNLADLQGSVEHEEDIDVFLLGALEAGDRLVVDAATAGSVLDVVIAVFDSQQKMVYENDDRNDSSSRTLDSYADFVVRHAGSEYYLVVSRAAFAEPGTRTGNYTIEVRVTPGYDVQEPVGQILLLDFDGARVDSPILGTMELEPFDAADIDPCYRGQTELMQDTIVETVAQNFERFNVIVLTSDDQLPVDPDSYSIVFFGGFRHDAFGIAEAVDLYNLDVCDDAIIYTESFTPDQFTQPPTAEELGIAIGNIASHEAGHLLGLNHVDDDLALMDAASPADAFLLDQEFMEAPLHSDIIPIGVQDAPMLLYESIGPAELEPVP